MYPKCLMAHIIAATLLCVIPPSFADANYAQRAKEQAERAAAAAAIAADQVEEARVANSKSDNKPIDDSLKGAETSVAPADNQQLTSTPNSQVMGTPTEAVRTDAQQSGEGGDGPLEDQPLVIDVSNLYDEDGLGDLTMQWQVQLVAGGWQTIDGAISQSFTPRQ